MFDRFEIEFAEKCISYYCKYHRNIWIIGCLGRKKAKFYQRLFSSLISEWILALGDEADDDAITSKDKAVRWKFEQLDVNNNSVCLYDIILLFQKKKEFLGKKCFSTS